jgi:hypothetical protein
MNFLESIEALSADMNKTANHLAARLQKTEPADAVYGTLHRWERICFDTSKQFERLLAEMPHELRDELANI